MAHEPELVDEVHLELGRWLADWSALVGTIRVEIMRCVAHEPSVAVDPDLYVRRSRAVKELVAWVDDGRSADLLRSAVIAMHALSHEQAAALDDLVKKFDELTRYRNRIAHDMIVVVDHDDSQSVLQLPFERGKGKATTRRDPESAAEHRPGNGDSLPVLRIADIRKRRAEARTLRRSVHAFVDTLT